MRNTAKWYAPVGANHFAALVRTRMGPPRVARLAVSHVGLTTSLGATASGLGRRHDALEEARTLR